MQVATVAIWYGMVALVSAFLWRFLGATHPGYSKRVVSALAPSLWRAAFGATFGAFVSLGEISTASHVNYAVALCMALSTHAALDADRGTGSLRRSFPPAILMALYAIGSLYYLERGQALGVLQVARWEILVSIVFAVATFVYVATVCYRAVIVEPMVTDEP